MHNQFYQTPILASPLQITFFCPFIVTNLPHRPQPPRQTPLLAGHFNEYSISINTRKDKQNVQDLCTQCVIADSWL